MKLKPRLKPKLCVSKTESEAGTILGQMGPGQLGTKTFGSQTNGSRTNESRTNGHQNKWVPDKWVLDKWVPDKWVPDKWQISPKHMPPCTKTYISIGCFESTMHDPGTHQLSHEAIISVISKVRGKIYITIPNRAQRSRLNLYLFVAAISRLQYSNRVTTKGPWGHRVE